MPTAVIDPTAHAGQPRTEGVQVLRRPDGSMVVDLRDGAFSPREFGDLRDLRDLRGDQGLLSP